MSEHVIFEILIIFILILANAFFAASEIAMISLNRNKVEAKARDGDGISKWLLFLLGEPSKLLATIQVGITLGGYFASAFATLSIAKELQAVLQNSSVLFIRNSAGEIAIVTVTLVLAYFNLVLGELVPKRLALINPEGIARATVMPILLVYFTAFPFVWILTFSTNLITRIFSKDINAMNEKITEEEIKMMIDVGEENGVINSIEREMIHGIFKFDNTLAKEIMTHRTEVFAVDINWEYNDIIARIVSEKYSRIPVYDESIDNIIGVIIVKDLFARTGNICAGDLNIREIMRKPFFVHESKNIDVLLKEFQDTRNSIAIIINEYGGFSGVVTIKDILREIVGDISDEYDDEEHENIKKVDGHTFIIHGKTTIKEINDELDVNIPLQPFGIISGFIISLIGFIPKKAEKKKIKYNNLEFEILSVSEKRIEWVKLKIDRKKGEE